MVKMSEKSIQFLKNNCPTVLEAQTVREALEILYMDILEKGFGGKRYEEYNDYGLAAQKVYDDIYYNSQLNS